MYTLDQIRCFVAVAEHLHFGRAAEELNMTQPPLSRQIQKLERAVGTLLLDRGNRHVLLTPAGEAFLVESRKLLALAHRAPLGARQVAAGRVGRLVIGFTGASGLSILGNVLALVGDAEPDVTVDLTEMVTGDQIQALAEERIDLGLGRVRSVPEGLTSRLLLSEKLVLALPQSHPLAALTRPLVRDDVAGLPLIMHSATRAQYFYDIVVRHFDIDHGQVKHTLSQVMTMVSLVAGGQGAALVPESVGYIKVPGVAFRALDDFKEEVVQLHALWNPETRNPAVTRALAAIGV